MKDRRDGAALLIALIFLLLIDGVVLGTVHIAMSERRLAHHAVRLLQLRLAADAAADAILAAWTAELDTHSAPIPLTIRTAPLAPGIDAEAALHALPGGLFMVVGRAREHAPAFGTAASALLLLPPPLPPSLDPYAGALSAAALLPSLGTVSAASGHTCSDEPGPGLQTAPPALRLHDATSLGLSPELSITGRFESLAEPPDVHVAIGRLASDSARTAILFSMENVLLDSAFAGVLATAGEARLAAGADVHGLVLAAGGVHVESGARVAGAVYTAGAARIDGELSFDACAVAAALARARLRNPRTLPHRPVIPAF